MKLKTIILAGFVTTAFSLAALAAGNWPLYPTVGVGANTQGTSQVPAGETALTGLETIPNDTQLPNGQSPQTQLVTVTTLLQGVTSTNSTATSATANAANTYSGALTTLRLTGAPSSGQTLTTVTAALLEAAIPNGAIGSTWIWKVVNVGGTSSGIWTVAGGSNVTVTGNATVAVGGSRVFYCTVTAVATPAVTCLDYGN